MKKNTVMRVLSLILVLTLMSTCAISSTFAKYVTKAEGEDKARVAKWGVVVTVNGNAFATEYAATDKAYLDDGGTLAVKASNTDQVVAPGTNSEQAKGTLVATVNGAPEVAARYMISGTGIKDVVLPAGTYTDYTHLKAENGTYGYTDTFTLTKDYAPIKWNLVITKGTTTFNVAEELYKALPANLMTVAESYGMSKDGCSFFDAIAILEKVANKTEYKNIVEKALGNVVSGGRNFELKADKNTGTFELSYDFDPNKEMGFKFELSWEWAFEQTDDVALYDAADTFLGNWAAVKLGQKIEGFVEPAAPANCEINATLTATATQID